MLQLVKFLIKDNGENWDANKLKDLYKLYFENNFSTSSGYDVIELNTGSFENILVAGPNDMFSRSHTLKVGEFLYIYGVIPSDIEEKYGNISIYYDSDSKDFVMKSDKKQIWTRKEWVEFVDNDRNESVNTKFVTKFSDFIK